MLKSILVATTLLAAGPALAQGTMQPFYGGQIDGRGAAAMAKGGIPITDCPWRR